MLKSVILIWFLDKIFSIFPIYIFLIFRGEYVAIKHIPIIPKTIAVGIVLSPIMLPSIIRIAPDTANKIPNTYKIIFIIHHPQL